jgi:predicted permease
MNVRSVLNMASARLGYETAGVFSGRFYVAGPAHAGAERQLEFARAVFERIRARPEVAAVALAGALPVHDRWADVQIENGAGGDASHRVATVGIMGDYLGVLGVRLLQGRSIDERDTRTAEKVALVNSVFAARAWPGRSPLGQRFRFGRREDTKPAPWLTVVGVVTPTVPGAFAETIAGQVYVPLAQGDEASFLSILTRARDGDAARQASPVRQVLQALDPNLPLLDPAPLEKAVGRVRQGRRLWAPTYLVFGCIALVLAGVGLYGVMSYSVSRRVPEIGVRVALGATPGQVAGLIARQAGGQLLAGLVTGSLIAYAAARQFGTYFFDVPPHDPVTYVVVWVTLTAAGVLACAVPIRRALRVSPIEALRCE